MLVLLGDCQGHSSFFKVLWSVAYVDTIIGPIFWNTFITQFWLDCWVIIHVLCSIARQGKVRMGLPHHIISLCSIVILPTTFSATLWIDDKRLYFEFFSIFSSYQSSALYVPTMLRITWFQAIIVWLRVILPWGAF